MSQCGETHHEACRCRGVACVESLDDMEFDRGIWYAAQYGDLERIEKLASKGVDLQDRAGYTALHHAARAGHADVCRRLLQLGAQPDARTRAGLATPLHRAASSGHTQIVKILLEAGANINMKDSDGQTALHRAAVSANIPSVQLLLRFGAQSLPDNRGRLPIRLVLDSPHSGNTVLIELLQ